jgi:hypothetical protein
VEWQRKPSPAGEATGSNETGQQGAEVNPNRAQSKVTDQGASWERISTCWFRRKVTRLYERTRNVKSKGTDLLQRDSYSKISPSGDFVAGVQICGRSSFFDMFGVHTMLLFVVSICQRVEGHIGQQFGSIMQSIDYVWITGKL